jgi:hypothetical protein
MKPEDFIKEQEKQTKAALDLGTLFALFAIVGLVLDIVLATRHATTAVEIASYVIIGIILVLVVFSSLATVRSAKADMRTLKALKNAVEEYDKQAE